MEDSEGINQCLVSKSQAFLSGGLPKIRKNDGVQTRTNVYWAYTEDCPRLAKVTLALHFIIGHFNNQSIIPITARSLGH